MTEIVERPARPGAGSGAAIFTVAGIALIAVGLLIGAVLLTFGYTYV
ncbi:MAG TPA: hypothetical protein VNY75_05425 [Rhizomicrobium sp.]|nr:hypothetical protein [Rhizomicrobium sp.]